MIVEQCGNAKGVIMSVEKFNEIWFESGYEDKDGFLCIDAAGVTYWTENGEVWSSVQN